MAAVKSRTEEEKKQSWKQQEAEPQCDANIPECQTIVAWLKMLHVGSCQNELDISRAALHSNKTKLRLISERKSESLFFSLVIGVD